MRAHCDCEVYEVCPTITARDTRTPEQVRERLEEGIGRAIFPDYDRAPSGTVVARARFLTAAANAVLDVLTACLDADAVDDAVQIMVHTIREDQARGRG